MKSRVIGIVVVLIFITNFCCGQGIQKDKLTVYGKARTFAKADRAVMTFFVEEEARNMREAFDKAQFRFDSLVAKLNEIGLEQDCLATNFFRNQENYGGKSFWSAKKDFRAVMSTTLTTKKLDLLTQIMIILSESGVDEISGVTFELVDYTKYRMDALEKAAQVAKKKSEIIAQQCDMNLGKVLELEEYNPNLKESGYHSIVSAQRMGIDFNAPLEAYKITSTSSGKSIFPDEIAFDTEVRMVVEILDNEAGGNYDEGK